MKLVVFLLVACVGVVSAQAQAQAEGEKSNELEKRCLEDLEKALSRLEIPVEVEQMVAIMQATHPDTPLPQVEKLSEQTELALRELGNQTKCQEFLKAFVIADDEVRCVKKIEFDDDFRRLIFKSQRISSLLDASAACFAVLNLSE